MSSPPGASASSPKVPPRPALGLAAYAAYVLTIAIFANLVFDVDYDEIADSAGNIVEGVIVPVGVGCLIMAAFATKLGWWRAVMTERPAGPRWMLIVPALMVVTILGGAAATSWGEWDADVLILLAVGTALVGFGEEMATRGLLLVGLRARLREVWVWLVTSGLFALMHGLNFFAGQDIGPTMQQIGYTFLIGSVLYVSRRVTGLLAVPIGLHFLYDFTLFASQGPGGAAHEVSAGGAVQSLGLGLAILVTLFALFRLLR